MSRETLFTTEGDVDLHGVYQHALDSRQALDAKMTQLVNAKELKRHKEAKFSDREVILTWEFRGANPEMSQAQMDKQIKRVLLNDKDWSDLRNEVLHLTGEVESAEADVSVLKRDILIACARMNSLGGHLFHLGSEKLA